MLRLKKTYGLKDTTKYNKKKFIELFLFQRGGEEEKKNLNRWLRIIFFLLRISMVMVDEQRILNIT